MNAALPVVVIEESRATLHHHARSFHLASLFLPARARDEAAVVYAFCRLVDDLGDETADAAEAEAALATLEAELVGDRSPRPLVAAYCELMERYGLGIGPAQELITGVRSDLGPVEVADRPELLRYCYRVAGTVGLMMCGVLGVDDPDARKFAIDLGVGMQITNICRDVAEDKERDRTYIPADRLRAHGGSPDELTEEPVRAVVRESLAVADDYYESGDRGMRYIPLRARLAILVASRVYRAIGVKLLGNGANPLDGRTIVSFPEKLWWIGVALITAFRLALQGEAPHDSSLHVALAGLPGTAPPE